MRAAIVGLGKMGLVHASVLNVLPNVELVALCDKSGLIRRFCKKLFDRAAILDDLEKLSSLGVDAVYVTTPIPTHHSVVKTLYSRKIVRNVFVEKTLASTYKEAKQLVALAKAFGGVNMVGYMKRFAVTFNKAKDLLNQEALGELISFDAYAYSSDFSGAKKDLQKSMARGGVLRDLGAHVVDLALFFFGDLHVSSAKLELFEEEGSEDSVCFKVEGSDGLEGRFDVSWCKENYRMPEFGLLVKGSKGILRVNDDKVELEVDGERSVWYRHNLDDSVGFLLGAPEYFREDEYFINSALEGTGVNLDFSASSKVDYIIDQVKHAAGEDD